MAHTSSAVSAVGRGRDVARLKAQVIALAEAAGEVDWDAQADSTVVRAH
jgi:hypothetical protein